MVGKLVVMKVEKMVCLREFWRVVKTVVSRAVQSVGSRASMQEGQWAESSVDYWAETKENKRAVWTVCNLAVLTVD